MSQSPESGLSPLDLIEDMPRILAAMRRAVREALLKHERPGNPIAVWREGRVVWLAPDEIPGD